MRLPPLSKKFCIYNMIRQAFLDQDSGPDTEASDRFDTWYANLSPEELLEFRRIYTEEKLARRRQKRKELKALGLIPSKKKPNPSSPQNTSSSHD